MGRDSLKDWHVRKWLESHWHGSTFYAILFPQWDFFVFRVRKLESFLICCFTVILSWTAVKCIFNAVIVKNTFWHTEQFTWYFAFAGEFCSYLSKPNWNLPLWLKMHWLKPRLLQSHGLQKQWLMYSVGVGFTIAAIHRNWNYVKWNIQFL